MTTDEDILANHVKSCEIDMRVQNFGRPRSTWSTTWSTLMYASPRSIAIVRRYTIKFSHFIRRTYRNQKGQSRWSSKEISHRYQQWIWKTQNDSEIAKREITFEVEMNITVYILLRDPFCESHEESNVNAINVW